MKALTVFTESAPETRRLGESIGRRLSGGETVLLSGPLGAGKTVLAQGISAGLGIRGAVRSPSFVLERVHPGNPSLRHLDFYRLTAGDVDEAGFFAEADDCEVTVVEWPERARETPEAALHFRLSFARGSPEKRKILIEALSPEWSEMIEDAVDEARSR